METILDGYWQSDLSQKKRDLILMDWCDELEDWPVESIKAALRHWRRDNPSKKPNPGHILQILNRAWGERNAEAVRAATSRQDRHEGMTPEQHAKVAEEMAPLLASFIKRVPEVKE